MNLDQAVFGNNSTLWDVLDTENVSNLNTEFKRLEEQVITLGRTVDNINTQLSDRINVLGTNLDNLTSEVNLISLELSILQRDVDEIDVSGLRNDIAYLQSQFNRLDLQVSNLNNTVTSLNSTVVTQGNRILNLEAQLPRSSILTSGTTYIWSFRVGTINYYRQITFQVGGNIPITANVFRSASILDSQTGTSYTTNVRLCAPFDNFRTVGTQPYEMILGGCYMQRTGDTGEGPLGYITPL